MSGPFDDFPLFAERMRQWEKQFEAKILSDFARGQWFDQGPGDRASILGRNRHVKACQRLIRRNSPDAYYDSSTGQWWLRACAVDAEVKRRNRVTAEKLGAMLKEPVKAEELARSGAEDEPSGTYELEWVDKLRSGT